MSYQQLPQQEKCTGHMERYVCIILLSIQGFRAPDGRKSPLPLQQYKLLNMLHCDQLIQVLSNCSAHILHQKYSVNSYDKRDRISTTAERGKF